MTGELEEAIKHFLNMFYLVTKCNLLYSIQSTDIKIKLYSLVTLLQVNVIDRS